MSSSVRMVSFAVPLCQHSFVVLHCCIYCTVYRTSIYLDRDYSRPVTSYKQYFVTVHNTLHCVDVNDDGAPVVMPSISISMSESELQSKQQRQRRRRRTRKTCGDVVTDDIRDDLLVKTKKHERRRKRTKFGRDRLYLFILCVTLLILSFVLVTLASLLKQAYLHRVERPTGTMAYPPLSSYDATKAVYGRQSLRMTHQRDKGNNMDEDLQMYWQEQLEILEQAIQNNQETTQEKSLPSHLFQTNDAISFTGASDPTGHRQNHRHDGKLPFSTHGPFFRVTRNKNINRADSVTTLDAQKMQWKQEWQQIRYQAKPHAVDYTKDVHYEYPSVRNYPPPGYPKFSTLQGIMEDWPQHQTDAPPDTIHEALQHLPFHPDSFDAAKRYIDQGLPFKFTNVPELVQANIKWTDAYISKHLDSPQHQVQGKCQESPNSFFTFFLPHLWNMTQLQALPPTRNNDMTFQEWSEHARYAEKTKLQWNRPHFYYQANVDKQERFQDMQSFISLDLPSFSSPNATVISPSPEEQNGIQCRFGERGVTAALHYDDGQNMIGMITGAKRYILLPPNQCSKLSIFTNRNHPLFRHSLLNLVRLLEDDEGVLGKEEREALDHARDAIALETVLKAGEVLFLPSYWFHYIIGLQKNAQCNVRSGVGMAYSDFGGEAHVTTKCVSTSSSPTRRAIDYV
jgi:Cupin-like domain